jgi:iron(III) transport system substrate-binding protein
MSRPILLQACALAAFAAFAPPASAQTAQPSWIMPDILAAAKAEGSVTVYSSVNEQEALPIWKEFQDATGIKVDYIRNNDAALTSRILIEARTGQQSWDALITTNVTRLPPQYRDAFDPPQAAGIMAQARDPQKRWYGVYANYNAPSYNTNLVKLDKPPKDFEEFLTHKEWIGHVGIDALEFPWMRAVYEYYGEAKGERLMKQLFAEFKAAPVDGHLALARAIGAGEYWVTPTNYINLTNNVKSTGAPTDYWGGEPLAVILGQVALNPKAPHPKAALLAANFLLSKEGQTAVARRGRLPTRPGVPTNPPDALKKLGDAKVVTLQFTPEQEKLWQKRYQDLLRGR